MTKKPPRMKAPMSVWARRSRVEGLKTTAQKSVTSARRRRPSPTMWKPAGVCCQELATMIQIAENIEPRETMMVEKKCMAGETRSQPKTSTARKPDSRKKAKMPSAARAEPKMSPT